MDDNDQTVELAQARGPVETKLWAAAAGAGGGGVVSAAVLWVLAVALWGAPADAAHAATAAQAVPGPISGLVLLLLAIAGAAIAGYMAPHTVRTDPDAVPAGSVLESGSPPLLVHAPATKMGSASGYGVYTD